MGDDTYQVRLGLSADAMTALLRAGGQYAKWEHLASDAVAIADALLAELARTAPND